MNILKFGGSSISSANSLQNILLIVNEAMLNGQRISIVVSALKGVTDSLQRALDLASNKKMNYLSYYQSISNIHFNLVEDIFQESTNPEILSAIDFYLNELKIDLLRIYQKGLKKVYYRDHILAYGELISSYIVISYLKSNGVEIELLDSRQLFITNNSFGNARVILPLTSKKINETINKTKTNYLITGFLGATRCGKTTILGRGGSDYTASILAVYTKASSITKWTDVNGILSCNPTLYDKAMSLHSLAYDELYEVIHYNSGVLLHSEAIKPLSNLQMPLLIRNTFNPSFPGTLIVDKAINRNHIISISKNCVVIKSCEQNFLVKGVLYLSQKSIYLAKLFHLESSFYVFKEAQFLKCCQWLNLLNIAPLKKEQLSLISITGSDLDFYEICSVVENQRLSIIASNAIGHSVLLLMKTCEIQGAVNFLHNYYYPYEILISSEKTIQ